jgi:hypothetical protein
MSSTVYASGSATLGAYYRGPSTSDDFVFVDGGTWRWKYMTAPFTHGGLTNISMDWQKDGNPSAVLNITIWTLSGANLGTKICDFASIPTSVGWSSSRTRLNISSTTCNITTDGTYAMVYASMSANDIANSWLFGRVSSGNPYASGVSAYGGPYTGTFTQEANIDYIFELWYNSTDLNPSGPAIDTTAPTITITYPNSSERLDGSLYLFSVIGTSSDDTAVNTTWINNTAFSNYGSKTSFNFTASGLATGNYSLMVFSNDSAGNKANATVNMLVDVLPPTITDNMPSKSTRLTSFRVNTTASDNYLIFSYNMTCLDPDNNIILSNYSNMILLKNYTWSGLLNLSGHNNWVVSCKNIVYDTHTSNDISILDAKPLTESKIEFTEEKTSLTIETSKEYSLITSKLTDRYTFIVKSKEKIKETSIFNRNYTITSNSKIFYLDKTKYKGHLISGSLWLDFEGSDSIIEIERINDYSVLIKETSTKDNVIFKSVGILNKAEYDFQITKDWEADIPIGICPSTLENVLILGLAVVIVLVLTVVSFAFAVPLLLFLCGFAMLIVGFYFMPCIWGIASIFYLMGFVEIFLAVVGFTMSK